MQLIKYHGLEAFTSFVQVYDRAGLASRAIGSCAIILCAIASSRVRTVVQLEEAD